MPSLESVLSRARKLVREREKAKSSNANQLFICSEYTKELQGELVIILYPKD